MRFYVFTASGFIQFIFREPKRWISRGAEKRASLSRITLEKIVEALSWTTSQTERLVIKHLYEKPYTGFFKNHRNGEKVRRL